MRGKTAPSPRSGVGGVGGLRFELTGGALCLDLINTVSKRPSPEPVDELASWRDLIAWAEQAGIINRRQARRLIGELDRAPRRGAALLETARELREALFVIFSTVAGGRGPAPGAALRNLNAFFPEALGSLRLAPSGGGYGWVLEGRGSDPARLLDPVVLSACELLVSGPLDRLRRCEAEPCDWIFLDTSRNGSRRWCDMAVCGNREKAKRHYARTRGGRQGNKSGGGAVQA